jgi:hypothetical protein
MLAFFIVAVDTALMPGSKMTDPASVYPDLQDYCRLDQRFHPGQRSTKDHHNMSMTVCILSKSEDWRSIFSPGLESQLINKDPTRVKVNCSSAVNSVHDHKIHTLFLAGLILDAYMKLISIPDLWQSLNTVTPPHTNNICRQVGASWREAEACCKDHIVIHTMSEHTWTCVQLQT